MGMDVKGIAGIGGLPKATDGVSGAGAAPRDGASDFGTVLKRSLAEVNRLQGEADAAVESLVTGKGVTLHETMIALEKADLSFRLMMQVRNKIVDAYREIVSMQV